MSIEQQTNLSSKLENTFLGVLRIVILIALSISIIGSLVFGIMGLSNLNATPAKYEYKDPNIKELVNELNKSLEGKPSQSEPKTSPSNDKPNKNEKLDIEIEKQVKLVTEFLGRYNREPNTDALRSVLKKEAENLAFNPKDQSSVVKYAKGQTDFFEKVFTNKEILSFFEKLDPSNFSNAYRPILDIYPDYFKEQRSEKKSFESEQNAEVMGQKAGAALNLYIAAGMFLTFLMISFILVLVKIERNLRVKTI
jgi:hypothetical protein